MIFSMYTDFFSILYLHAKTTLRSWAGLLVPVALVTAMVLGFTSVPTASASGAVTGWTLERLVIKTITNNPQVLIQRYTAAAAKAGVSEAKWQFFPAPTLEAEAWDDNRLLEFEIRQPLYAGGRLFAGLKLAQLQHAKAQLSIHEVRYSLALKVINTYEILLRASRGRDVYESSLQHLAYLGSLTQRRIEAGISGKGDYNLVISRIGQVHDKVNRMKESERSAAVAMSQLVGEHVSLKQIVTVDDRTHYTFRVGDVIRRCLDYHPGLRLAAAEIEIVKAQAIQAQKAIFPTLFVSWESTKGNGPEAEESTAERYYLGLSSALGGGLSTLSKVRSAKAKENAARGQYSFIRRNILTTVSSEMETYRSTKDIVTVLRASAAIQKELFESYQRMFLAGKRTWLELLNAVQERTNIEYSLAEAEVKLLIAAYRLRLQTGELAWLKI